MKNYMKIIFLMQCFLGSLCLERFNLDGIWKLNGASFRNLSATVPGGIYTDLQNNGIIDDPIYGNNDVNYKWIGRTNWNYSRTFTVSQKLASYSNLFLIFEGVDTVSSIYLNGNRIGSTSNMFVRYAFDVKDKVVIGNNFLEVELTSPVAAAAHLASIQDKSYPVPPQCPPEICYGECHVNQLRKMQASFSWDWGPSFPSVGIWKDVRLEAYNSSSILYTVVEMIDNSIHDTWEITVKTYLANYHLKHVKGDLIISLQTKDDTLSIKESVDVIPTDLDEIEVVSTFEIDQIKVNRWWPNGYGSQNLYNLTVKFISDNEQDVQRKMIGFRTVELVQEDLTLHGITGKSFYLKVNGIPIFAKGSNSIPLSILPEKGQDRGLVDRVLTAARDSNMNMLRAWGGGVYESDYYYEKADALGIMLWQDFMFACALYPARDDFLSNVVAEVRHQVRRISSHPSIVVWAGNNENEAALTGNWYGSGGKPIYNKDYVKLYFGIIKPEFEKIIKYGNYVSSSPTNGIKSEEDGGFSKNPYDPLYGDVHTYFYLLDVFLPTIYPTPRFCAEYGLQSYPSLSSMSSATRNKSDLILGSEFLQHRQHHPLGDSEMGIMIGFQLKLPKKGSSNYTNVFIFYSQVIQAVGIKVETEHYRKFRSLANLDGTGHTMGAMYWQLNDVWIAPSWSGIDVNGKWKMLQYYVRDVFAPVIIIPHLNNERTLEVTINSDKTVPIDEAVLRVSVYKWDSFEPIKSIEHDISIKELSSKIVMNMEIDGYLNSLGCGSLSSAKLNCFLHFELLANGTAIAPDNHLFPAALKSLNLTTPDIRISSIQPESQGNARNFSITIQSSSIALFVWLDCAVVPGIYSHNGFHQLNKTRVIKFYSEKDTSVAVLKNCLDVSNILQVNTI